MDLNFNGFMLGEDVKVKKKKLTLRYRPLSDQNSGSLHFP